MKGTFEFKGKNGGICRLEAEYECVMENRTVDADGDIMILDPKPTTSGRCNLVAYINGKQVDSCRIPSFWRVIDNPNGIKKIWGMPIGFPNDEIAKEYEEWIAKIIEDGTSDEVKEYNRQKKDLETKRKVEGAKKLIEEAEKQKDIPSKEEAARRMKHYNDIVNEGGEGYVPHIVSMEEYTKAKKFLEEIGEK